MFCPKCGSILRPKKEETGRVLSCSCGYKTSNFEGSVIKETVKNRIETVDVVDKKTEHLPLSDAICPKCSHTKAYYWLVQTRAGDEPETRFNRCEKCGHTWRDYG